MQWSSGAAGDCQRRLYVGDRRDSGHPDERLLGGAGGQTRPHKNLAIELAPNGIRVNTVALAFVETPAYERFMTREAAREVLDSVNAFHPLGRHGRGRR